MLDFSQSCGLDSGAGWWNSQVYFCSTSVLAWSTCWAQKGWHSLSSCQGNQVLLSSYSPFFPTCTLPPSAAPPHWVFCVPSGGCALSTVGMLILLKSTLLLQAWHLAGFVSWSCQPHHRALRQGCWWTGTQPGSERRVGAATSDCLSFEAAFRAPSPAVWMTFHECSDLAEGF